MWKMLIRHNVDVGAGIAFSMRTVNLDSVESCSRDTLPPSGRILPNSLGSEIYANYLLLFQESQVMLLGI